MVTKQSKGRGARMPSKARESPASTADARGKVRIYADVSVAAATELAVLAAKRRLSKKALLELLIMEASRTKGA